MIMKNKVTVSIAGEDYTLIAAEEESYVKRCAALVDEQLRQVMDGGHLARANGAVLAAMNIADQYLREQNASENLRRQIKELLEESAKLKLELSEAKRALFKAQNGK